MSPAFATELPAISPFGAPVMVRWALAGAAVRRRKTATPAATIRPRWKRSAIPQQTPFREDRCAARGAGGSEPRAVHLRADPVPGAALEERARGRVTAEGRQERGRG